MSQDIFSPSTDESLVFRAVEMFRRRQLVAILASAAVMASAVSFAVCLPDLFRATAIVLVERPIPEVFVRPAVNGELDSRLHVIKQEILSRDRLTDLITRSISTRSSAPAARWTPSSTRCAATSTSS